VTLNGLAQLTDQRSQHVVVHYALNFRLAMLRDLSFQHVANTTTDLASKLCTQWSTENSPTTPPAMLPTELRNPVLITPKIITNI
jgi:hypothetical protein